MAILVETIIRGLMLGSVYALVGMGLTLVWGVVGIVNIAHGEFVMLGAYFAFWAFSLIHLNPLFSVLLSIPLFFFVGVLIHRQITERLVKEHELSALILTFGMSILIWNLAQVFWTNTYRSVSYLTGSFPLLGLVFSKSKTVSFGLARPHFSGAFPLFEVFQLGESNPGNLAESGCGARLRHQYEEDENDHFRHGNRSGRFRRNDYQPSVGNIPADGRELHRQSLCDRCAGWSGKYTWCPRRGVDHRGFGGRCDPISERKDGPDHPFRHDSPHPSAQAYRTV